MPSKCIRTPRNSEPEVLRDFMRRAFVAAVGGCAIQGDAGWPCRTCFYDLMERLGIKGEEAHAFWLIQLRMRNDGSLVEDMYTVKTIPTAKGLEVEARIQAYQTTKENVDFHD